MKGFALARTSAALVLACVLVSCNRTEAPPKSQAAPADVAIGRMAEDGTEPRSRDRKARTPLPRGIDIGYEHVVLQDEVSEVKRDEFIRRIRVEYLNSTADQVIDAMTREFAESGYIAGDQQHDDEGRTRIEFRRPKRATFRITVREGGQLINPEARGVVQYNFAVAAPAQDSSERRAP